MDRLVVVRKGAIEVAFPPIDVAPIVIGPLVSRIEADRVVVVRKSTVPIALMVLYNGPDWYRRSRESARSPPLRVESPSNNLVWLHLCPRAARNRAPPHP